MLKPILHEDINRAQKGYDNLYEGYAIITGHTRWITIHEIENPFFIRETLHGHFGKIVWECQNYNEAKEWINMQEHKNT